MDSITLKQKVISQKKTLPKQQCWYPADIDDDVRERWEEIGQTEGLPNDSAITRFLISLYFQACRSGGQTSDVRCDQCHNPLTFFCVNCKLIVPPPMSGPHGQQLCQDLHSGHCGERNTRGKPEAATDGKTTTKPCLVHKNTHAAGVRTRSASKHSARKQRKPKRRLGAKRKYETVIASLDGSVGEYAEDDVEDGPVGEWLDIPVVSHNHETCKDEAQHHETLVGNKQHLVQVHQCQLCQTQFKSKIALQQHKCECCLELEETECSHHDFTSLTLEDSVVLDKKQSTDKETKGIKYASRYQCPACAKTFKIKSAFLRHKRGCDRQDSRSKGGDDEGQGGADSTGYNSSYTCTLCERGFKNKSALQQHKRVHRRQEHQCSVCGLSFRFPSRLAKHIKVHAEDRPHVCERCGKSFASVYYLRDHIKIHSEERRYKCEECGAAFKQKPALYAHSKKHSDAKPFQCQYCGLKFRDSQKVKIHVRSHTGERPYQCPLCDATFVSNSNMWQHAAYVHGKSTKLHSCLHCPLSFAAKGKLKVHVKNCHTEQPPSRTSNIMEEPADLEERVVYVTLTTKTEKEMEVGSAEDVLTSVLVSTQPSSRLSGSASLLTQLPMDHNTQLSLTLASQLPFSLPQATPSDLLSPALSSSSQCPPPPSQPHLQQPSPSDYFEIPTSNNLMQL